MALSGALPYRGAGTLEDPDAPAPASILRTAPSAPSPPLTPPVDALASTTTVAGTGGGHGLSLFLSLSIAGWALLLAGRRLLSAALNLPQPTYSPLVSPG